jgi:hypothetical protein
MLLRVSLVRTDMEALQSSEMPILTRAMRRTSHKTAFYKDRTIFFIKHILIELDY